MLKAKGWLAMAWSLVGMACETNPKEFNASVAREDCNFAARCTPELFEPRCQVCTSDAQCPVGACDRKSGRCRDQQGRFSMQGQILDVCNEQSHCGDYVCRRHWESANVCYESGLAPLEKSRELCSFDEDVARECERLLLDRSCKSSRPPICEFVYDECMR